MSLLLLLLHCRHPCAHHANPFSGLRWLMGSLAPLPRHRPPVGNMFDAPDSMQITYNIKPTSSIVLSLFFFSKSLFHLHWLKGNTNATTVLALFPQSVGRRHPQGKKQQVTAVECHVGSPNQLNDHSHISHIWLELAQSALLHWPTSRFEPDALAMVISKFWASVARNSTMYAIPGHHSSVIFRCRCLEGEE